MTRMPLTLHWKRRGNPRTLGKINIPKKKELELDLTDEGIMCKNGLTIKPADISGLYVYAPDRREYEISRFAQTIGKIPDSSAKAYRKLKDLTIGIPQDQLTVSKLFDLSVKAMNDNPMIADRVEYFHELKENSREICDQPGDKSVYDLTEREYVELATFVLFYLFAGPDTPLVMKDFRVYHPTVVALFGEEFWWVMHLAVPALNVRYWKYFSRQIRPNMKRRVFACQFSCVESFAIDFWERSRQAFDFAIVKGSKELQNKFGTVGSVSLIHETATSKKIKESEVTEEDQEYLLHGMLTGSLEMEENIFNIPDWDIVRAICTLKKYHRNRTGKA